MPAQPTTWLKRRECSPAERRVFQNAAGLKTHEWDNMSPREQLLVAVCCYLEREARFNLWEIVSIAGFLLADWDEIFQAVLADQSPVIICWDGTWLWCTVPSQRRRLHVHLLVAAGCSNYAEVQPSVMGCTLNLNLMYEKWIKSPSTDSS